MRYGILKHDLTYEQACSLCALGSRIAWNDPRFQDRFILSDNVTAIENAHKRGITTFCEYGPLPDNLLTD